MDIKRRKQLLEDYKLRKPEMGVLAFRWGSETFVMRSRDTTADTNSNRFQLLGGNHSNKRMQALWDLHGPDGLTVSVIELLEYDDPREDHTKELDKMLEAQLMNNPDFQRVRK